MEESNRREVVPEGSMQCGRPTTASFWFGACEVEDGEGEEEPKKHNKTSKDGIERCDNSDQHSNCPETGNFNEKCQDQHLKISSTTITRVVLASQDKQKPYCSKNGLYFKTRGEDDGKEGQIQIFSAAPSLVEATNGENNDEDGDKEGRIQIPCTTASLVEMTNSENDDIVQGEIIREFDPKEKSNTLFTKDLVEMTNNEDENAFQVEIIPEFDPKENSNSLFTEELHAVVEEGSEPHLASGMSVGDPSCFSSDGPQMDSDETSKESNGTMNDGRGRLLLLAVPPHGAQELTMNHLDGFTCKIHDPSTFITSQGEQGANQYPFPMGQEDGGDKNPALFLDEGERTPRHPRWTREETLVLLGGKRKRDEEIRALQLGSQFTSATERWDFISNYCKAHGVDRDAHQCRKRWSNMAADFKKIRNWHKQSCVEPYWSMRGDSRRKNKLPGSFDPQVYGDMEAASDCNALKKKKVVPPSKAEDSEEHHYDQHHYDPLASVLESSGRAMQAALARNIQAQIEAHNQNSELDRVQRKEQSDSLVGVLGLLADSLTRIAEKL